MIVVHGPYMGEALQNMIDKTSGAQKARTLHPLTPTVKHDRGRVPLRNCIGLPRRNTY